MGEIPAHPRSRFSVQGRDREGRYARGDHWSFANQVTAVEKCLRIRREPPATRTEDPVDNAKQQIFSPNDMQRAALGQYMFFQAWAIEPNLIDTKYGMPDGKLLAAAAEFDVNLNKVNDAFCKVISNTKPDPFAPQAVTTCQPLNPIPNPTPASHDPDDAWIVPYARTIPQSIQY